MADPDPLDYSRYPRMAHWFSPLLLAKLLNNVILSSIFGHYADRRLIVAALDTVDAKTHLDRATALKARLQPDADGAVWIDWVADLGDGFDSTYAVASLLARKELALGDLVLPRGQALFMGGDEVYPKASAQAYKNQLRQPYAWAFPDHHTWWFNLMIALPAAFLAAMLSWHFVEQPAMAKKKKAIAWSMRLYPKARRGKGGGTTHSTLPDEALLHRSAAAPSQGPQNQ